ncbi:hypothetical protein Clacol_005636 [Clathrus columnatus]|uniref:Fatty acid hydroxylase domain-containing protein n=1 Tax=Clathrus columnatus TaxID=1419009 RepID=A0AAV5AD51_9AGAM|nr:hypothetical protein Clacol_005636 [Clathrus columnatus]
MDAFSPFKGNGTSLFNSDALVPNPVRYPIYHIQAPSLIPGLKDNYLALLAPIVAYWAYSLFFYVLDLDIFEWPSKYRIHESEEMRSKNLASPWDVFLAVVFQHVVQTVLGVFWLDESGKNTRNHLEDMRQLSMQVSWIIINLLGHDRGSAFLQASGQKMIPWLYWWGIPIVQFLFAIFIIDTWQYFIHRAMHINKTLYKYLHSVHHRLYVPYAYGALYNNPLEGFIMDSLGAAISEYLSGSTNRQATVLFVLSTLKTVDDHCGYRLPWDPFQILCRNNADYHDIHHQALSTTLANLGSSVGTSYSARV